jgi:hypothetical protein
VQETEAAKIALRALSLQNPFELESLQGGSDALDLLVYL